MAFDFDKRVPQRVQSGVARSMAAEDASARNSVAVLVVAFACALSGLMMGLCLAASPWPALSFVFGALFAGSGVWFLRDLIEALRR